MVFPNFCVGPITLANTIAVPCTGKSSNIPVQVVIATFAVIYSTDDTLLDLVRSLFQGMGDTTFFLGRRPFFLYGLFGQMESANQISIFLPHLIAINIDYY